MFYCSNAYGTVFKVEVTDKRVKARISTSEKNKDGEYINSYWNAAFVGNAYDLAKSLTDKDRIHINKCKITNEDYTTKDGEKRSWLQVTIFDFEKLEHNSEKSNSDSSDDDGKKDTSKKSKNTKKSTKKTIEEKVAELEDDELPF